MDGPRDGHTEWDREEKTSYNVRYMWNLERNDTSELTYKTERLTEVEKGLMVARGKRQGEGLVEEFGTDMYTHLYLKWTASKDLL